MKRKSRGGRRDKRGSMDNVTLYFVKKENKSNKLITEVSTGAFQIITFIYIMSPVLHNK